jgi:predicted TIM-barrel fold metal-dependent hydrolase
VSRNLLKPLGRRDFLRASLAAAGAAVLGKSCLSSKSKSAPADLIDVNINLGRWPLRRVRFDDTGGLVSMLRRQGVTQAWAGSFECLLHKDIATLNARLADECRRFGHDLLVPFGSVNPKLPDWEDDLRRCAEEHRMPGIRLHPNYHGYRLDDPNLARLARLAVELGLLVQMALIMEDQRMMHPLLRVEPTDPGPLANLVKQTPGLRLVLLNALRTLRDKPLADVVAAGDVSVEISMLDGFAGVANLLSRIPSSRVLFGSYAPLFYFEAARLKLQESPFSGEDLHAIRVENARLLLKKHT